MTTFLDLGVPAPLAAVLAESGKTEAFPIQRDTLPDSLAGRDVLGRGRTGSGKTIAFALPMVARLTGTASRPGHPRGLILAPTRELASQIAATLEPLARAANLRVTTVFGGVSQRPQEDAMRRGVDIVVACPGRLEDLMKQGVVKLDAVKVAVLDEADHMADLGFLPGVTRILNATPAGGQRLLFSATLDGGIGTLVRRFLSNAVSHEVDESSVPEADMEHRVFEVRDADAKKDLVQHLASGLGRRILFTRTKHQAKKLAKQLIASGIPAVDLHGNLSQNARERNLAAFSADPADGGVRVLVATDVAARGVHVDNVELVVHVDPPAEHKAYLHRSGRTARAGASGVVVTILMPEQRRDVKDLLRKAQISVGIEQVAADTAVVTELVGERAPHVRPAPVQQTTNAPARKKPAGQGAGSDARGRRRGGQGGQSQGGSRPGQSAQGGQRSQGGQSRSAQGQAQSAQRHSSQGRPTGAQGAQTRSAQAHAGQAPASRHESRNESRNDSRDGRRAPEQASRPARQSRRASRP